jgi:CBS domain containing-hemolysin-like protein
MTTSKEAPMSILLTVVTLTLAISALCSLCEATLYSTRTGALEAVNPRSHTGRLARRFLGMKRHIEGPIAAILILNTLANTAGATMAGMYATHVFGAGWLPVFSGVFTLGILLCSEILPKTLGALYWRRLWPSMVLPLTVMQTLLHPAIRLTQLFTRLLTHGQTSSVVTEEEIIAMARLSAQAGEISAQESRMVQNIIKLEEQYVRDVMTPRPVMFALDAYTTVAEALPLVTDRGFSRVPIYEENREHITGYVILHDLSMAQVRQQTAMPLRSLAKSIVFVPETANCFNVLMMFLEQRLHIAIVVDEYGGVAGLVTLEDLLETMLGTEIVGEADRVVDLRQSARNRRVQGG